jgi:ferredoxin
MMPGTKFVTLGVETDMKKRYNVNLIVSTRIYDFRMISKRLGVHKRTIQNWHKQGLLIVDTSARPYLVRGSDLKASLHNIQKLRKCLLSADQFYCLKCHTGRLACPESISYEETHHKLGKSAEQVILFGKCDVCGTPVRRFSSKSDATSYEDKTAKERLMYNRDMPSKHHLQTPSPNNQNIDIIGEQNEEKN